MKGLHEYTLLQRVEEIKLCLENQMWQAGLALALTIPDICGQIKFKDIKQRNTIGEKYSQWFKEYVEHYYADESGWSGGTAKQPYFTGEMCYKLRCSFLHSGSNTTKYNFALRVNSCDTYSLNNKEFNCIEIDIEDLCNFICMGALSFYKEWGNHHDFTDKKCVWLDVKEWYYRNN
ncbi:hypothetical protein MKA27_13155 [[Clostridium] innocuum]|uniref:hypothetical protein n=1 Tax=Clostridium innocuum TaxID=1522 RepID=UPI000D6CC5F6|nr:hypothetical protein [[Clostridium] innocuum]MCR0315256.1 hypothetical protein [[Clostridium] innocuum]MCR0369722.1 hypothetical protein [[Clostridium] innocuum]MCR0374767.1 hypothetical protein [[Clostridium] innocuum]MCR0559675.1 hypothetical protein [[Clostridium] innocuum]MCR0602631.1 hypothetical protein [[Clostridium] innocuum]